VRRGCGVPVAGGVAAAANAQDSYKIGVTAAMTGPAAATQAPVIEMLRIYDRGALSGRRGRNIRICTDIKNGLTKYSMAFGFGLKAHS
jgi:hypothetical protein